MQNVQKYLDDHRRQREDALCELLRIPSVSANPAHRTDCDRAADWVAQRLRDLEFAVEVIPTPGHRLVYAESPAVADAPTALVYGHYDVQPPEPLADWISPPFEPTERDGNLYARGATDDKGQMLTHILAAEAWIRSHGRVPLNLKFIIEGEEEVGSKSLEAFIRAHADRLACDCVVISDGAQFAPGKPAICYGLRGIAYYELHLRGPQRDLHSGSFGGTVTNPANALAAMLAGLTDDQGRVQIRGFYDDVVPLSDRERELLAALPFDGREYLAGLGVSDASGEAGYTLLERRWARPTYDVCGLTSGYQGEGAKTILPATASAKFSFRLVPDQRPEAVTEGLRRRLNELCPPGIEMELHDFHGSPGVLVPLESPYVKAASRAIARAFGTEPVFTREGGSIPIVSAFRDALGVDTLLLGWGQDDDNTHSPNERFSLADFHRGTAASAALWAELAAMKTGA